jgi:hypothetical protein
VVGSSPDDDYCTVFVCVSPQSCVERVVLTKCSHEEVAQALGLVVSTSRAKRVRCTIRPISVVENLSSAPSCPPYQTTSNEALHGGDDAPNLNSTPSSPAVDNPQHQDRAVAPEHHSGVDRSCAVTYEQASGIEGKGGPIGILPDHTTLGDEVFSAGAKSPNTATQEAMKHQRNSDDLFDEPFELMCRTGWSDSRNRVYVPCPETPRAEGDYVDTTRPTKRWARIAQTIMHQPG